MWGVKESGDNVYLLRQILDLHCIYQNPFYQHRCGSKALRSCQGYTWGQLDLPFKNITLPMRAIYLLLPMYYHYKYTLSNKRYKLDLHCIQKVNNATQTTRFHPRQHKNSDLDPAIRHVTRARPLFITTRISKQLTKLAGLPVYTIIHSGTIPICTYVLRL